MMTHVKFSDPVAQSVEQHPFKVMVAGSIPAGVTKPLKTFERDRWIVKNLV